MDHAGEITSEKNIVENPVEGLRQLTVSKVRYQRGKMEELCVGVMSARITTKMRHMEVRRRSQKFPGSDVISMLTLQCTKVPSLK